MKEEKKTNPESNLLEMPAKAGDLQRFDYLRKGLRDLLDNALYIDDKRLFERLSLYHALASEIIANSNNSLLVKDTQYFLAEILTMSSLLTGVPEGCEKAQGILQELLQEGKTVIYVEPGKRLDIELQLMYVKEECRGIFPENKDEDLYRKLTPTSLDEFSKISFD